MTGADAIRIETTGAVEVRSLAHRGSLGGVVIRHAAGANGAGFGRLRFDGDALAWRAPGSAVFGPVVPVAVDGTFVVEDGEDRSKFVRVEVFADFLPVGTGQGQVELRDLYGGGESEEDVAAALAAAGGTQEWELELSNQSASGIDDLRVWLDAETSDLEISDDGVAWVAPDDENHADVLRLGSLAPAGAATLYLRRTTGMGAGSDPRILEVIRTRFDSY